MSMMLRGARWSGLLLGAALTVAGVSCGGGGKDGPVGPTGGTVSRIDLSPGTASIVSGQSSTITAAPKDASGAAVTGQTVSWTTSDASVATVSGGVVSAHNPGTANVVASVGSVQATAAITVIPAVASVVVTPNPASVVIGQTTQLTATAKDASGTTIADRAVTWTSSNDLIATVVGGLVTSKSLGSVTITATVDGKSGTATVNVTPVPVATVTVTPPASTLLVGATGSLSAAARDANGAALTGRTITWASSNQAVATVTGSGESAVVTAVAVGSATITATSEGKSATSDISVIVPPANAVTVSPSTVSVAPGATAQLTATVTDATGHPVTGSTVAWTTSDASKATVNATTGLVTGVSYGTVTITATSGGKSGTATVKVTDVVAPQLAGLTFTPSTVDVTGGTKTVLVSAHVTDAGGSGTSQIAVVATAPHGAFANCSTTTLAAGTAADGTWNCSITIPKGAEPGDWGILVLVSDAAQNVSTYTAKELTAASLPTKFSVLSNWDQTPPVFASLSVTPSTVDVSSASKTVTVSARLTDNASGVSRFDFSAQSPNGTTVGCAAQSPASGTDLDGTWTCTITIPAQADPGTWAITVKATDRAFYSQTYNKNIGFPAGFPASFTVTR